MSRTLSMPENLLLTHWLAGTLNATHIMYYQTVIDENTQRLTAPANTVYSNVRQ